MGVTVDLLGHRDGRMTLCRYGHGNVLTTRRRLDTWFGMGLGAYGVDAVLPLGNRADRGRLAEMVTDMDRSWLGTILIGTSELL